MQGLLGLVHLAGSSARDAPPPRAEEAGGEDAFARLAGEAGDLRQISEGTSVAVALPATASDEAAETPRVKATGTPAAEALDVASSAPIAVPSPQGISAPAPLVPGGSIDSRANPPRLQTARWEGAALVRNPGFPAPGPDATKAPPLGQGSSAASATLPAETVTGETVLGAARHPETRQNSVKGNVEHPAARGLARAVAQVPSAGADTNRATIAPPATPKVPIASVEPDVGPALPATDVPSLEQPPSVRHEGQKTPEPAARAVGPRDTPASAAPLADEAVDPAGPAKVPVRAERSEPSPKSPGFPVPSALGPVRVTVTTDAGTHRSPPVPDADPVVTAAKAFHTGPVAELPRRDARPVTARQDPWPVETPIPQSTNAAPARDTALFPTLPAAGSAAPAVSSLAPGVPVAVAATGQQAPTHPPRLGDFEDNPDVSPHDRGTVVSNPAERPASRPSGPVAPLPAVPPTATEDALKALGEGADQLEPATGAEDMGTVSETGGRTATAVVGTAARGPDAPRAVFVARQIAEAAGVTRDGQIEITLSPEELGRVRMTMTPGDAGLSVTIFADRPETLDLLRRHIDILARDLGEQGFTSLDFAFGQPGSGQNGTQSDDGGGPAAPDHDRDSPRTTDDRRYPPPPRAAAGLDLRM